MLSVFLCEFWTVCRTSSYLVDSYFLLNLSCFYFQINTTLIFWLLSVLGATAETVTTNFYKVFKIKLLAVPVPYFCYFGSFFTSGSYRFYYCDFHFLDSNSYQGGPPKIKVPSGPKPKLCLFTLRIRIQTKKG